MMRKAMWLGLATAVLVTAGCTDAGNLKNPFKTEAPFVPTAVPADFGIVVDENHDTYYSRQHLQQVISASDAMSTTKYTTYRDYNNSVSDSFSQETPLSAAQLQDMWNEVSRYNLMNRSTPWINWLSDADLYRRDAYTIQIRANGQTRAYRQTDGFSGAVRPLMRRVEGVRLPINQDTNTPVVSPRPATEPAADTMPAAMPAGATMPAATEPGK